VGKNKIARWAELGTYSNVIQPVTGEIWGKNHWIKGSWNRDVFKNNNPVILELGCGKGEYTTGLSVLFPSNNFIGVDIKGARMWRGAKTASEKQLKTVAFLRTRIEFINSFFATDEVDEIWITFPDPHPGNINSNKRLTCPWFLNIYRNFVKEKGIIHLKTDNTELYDYTRKLVRDNGLEIVFSTNDMHSMCHKDLQLSGHLCPHHGEPGPEEPVSKEILSIRTHYEAKFLEKGMSINYLAFRLEKDKSICHAWEQPK
jgi:tRNA (guanine-N7-)-methyltransferase